MTRCATSRRPARLLPLTLLAAALFASGCGAVQDAASDALQETTETTVAAVPDEATTTDPPGAVREELNMADIPTDAVRFVDPDGAYVVDFDPSWTQGETDAAGTEVWFTGEGTDTFNNNINIGNSPLDASVPSDMGELIDASWQSIVAAIPDATLENSGGIATAADPATGFLQWSAPLQGQQLDFVTYFGVWNEQLVTLTYTQVAGGPDVFAEALPYLVTLRRPE